MKFSIIKEKIKVISDSGNIYWIDSIGCSCPGFGWRKKCKHFDYALSHGLLNKLIKNKCVFRGFKKTPFIIASRKNAIKQWLKNRRLKITDKLINKIEEKIAYGISIKQVFDNINN